ncbi:alpha/beta fold hydrolase [Glycomyces mayteni]|uniref:Alpha/beta fold hydrolase n=1 Tax=Glycomyces mayteni TaxID=543887 RepID=A0ABW2D287_9ACTN|nr:alpha/beta hydrolase [Glycomyces mayteni]
MTDPTTHTLEAPGAELHYDVREGEAANAPTLLIIGSPMAAAGFATLASHFPDRRVVTYDPRGSERSRRTDGAAESTPEEHADDLHRVIAAVGGPVDVFASSGGAVNALALVAKHPEQVRTLVAHEPPASSALPDRDAALAAARDIQDTYRASGFGPAMAKFIALVSYDGEIPATYLDGPAPDPAAFGLPAEDDGTRDDPLVGQNIVTCNAYEHDFKALRAAPTRIVLAVGADSGETLAARGGRAVAERIGVEPTVLPGDHGGFLGGEYGQTGKPDEFAAALREVLSA